MNSLPAVVAGATDRWKTRFTRSNLIALLPSIASIGKRYEESQTDNNECQPRQLAQPHGLLRLRMKIKSRPVPQSVELLGKLQQLQVYPLGSRLISTF